jgi:hypothetical protein
MKGKDNPLALVGNKHDGHRRAAHFGTAAAEISETDANI